MSIETSPELVSPERLTRALADAGVLDEGQISDVSIEFTRETILSRITKLRLAYRGRSAGAPETLIVKTALPDRLSAAWDGGRREVAFYNQVAFLNPVAASAAVRLTPRCFEAAFDAKTKDWRIVLEDLGDTHRIATPWPLPPTAADCERIVRTWARFHAQWWDDPRLGLSIGRWRDAEADDAHRLRSREAYAQFAERFGDRLPQERRRLYESLLDRAPLLLKRFDSRRSVTIVHGDAHVWNCFLPRDGAGEVRLFDWDSWRLGAATEDLAYMMAVHWYPDRRRRLEGWLLDAYHSELSAAGVSRYSRRELADDYRLSTLWQIMTPVWQAGANIPSVIWWNNFERVHLAAEDLDCRALLG